MPVKYIDVQGRVVPHGQILGVAHPVLKTRKPNKQTGKVNQSLNSDPQGLRPFQAG